MSAASPKKKQVVVMEKIFTWPSDDPRLKATKCKKCGQYYFPVAFRCQNPDCFGDQMEDVLLSKKGKLWTYTIDYYPLPPPFRTEGEFKPFGVGEVEFPEGVRIAGIITNCDATKDLKIGMDMDLVFEKLFNDEEGNEVIGWKFQPSKKAAPAKKAVAAKAAVAPKKPVSAKKTGAK